MLDNDCDLEGTEVFHYKDDRLTVKIPRIPNKNGWTILPRKDTFYVSFNHSGKHNILWNLYLMDTLGQEQCPL